MSQQRTRVFSNGFEADLWMDCNCFKCSKEDECDIEEGIGLGYVGDGLIDQELIDRAGGMYEYAERGKRVIECKEFEPRTDEVKS